MFLDIYLHTDMFLCLNVFISILFFIFQFIVILFLFLDTLTISASGALSNTCLHIWDKEGEITLKIYILYSV